MLLVSLNDSKQYRSTGEKDYGLTRQLDISLALWLQC